MSARTQTYHVTELTDEGGRAAVPVVARDLHSAARRYALKHYIAPIDDYGDGFSYANATFDIELFVKDQDGFAFHVVAYVTTSRRCKVNAVDGITIKEVKP